MTTSYLYEVSEALLREVVRRILAIGSPEKIILFGSRARGDSRPDSDLDLLVIDEVSSREQQSRYRRAVGDLELMVDVKLASRFEVEGWRNVRNHFLTTIVREGRVLYEREDRIAETPEPTKDQADHAREWLRKGDEDMEPADLVLQGGRAYWTACFHAQQAAEKYMKGLLAYRGEPIPRTHDLCQLRELLGWIPDGVVPEAELQSLSEFAVEARYAPGPSATREQAAAFVELAKRVRAEVVRYLPELSTE